MIQSMTGFASKTLTIIRDKDNKANVSIHLKTLNARYFELNAKLPHALSHIETDLLKLFKKTLHRGYVYFNVFIDNPSIFKGAIEPSMGIVEGYITSIDKISARLKIKEKISLDTLVRLPNIFNVKEQDIDKKSSEVIMRATAQLIKQLILERKKEGAELKKDFELRFSIMAKEIDIIKNRSKQLIEEQKKKISLLTQELKDEQNEITESRKGALYAMLDKMDIHEEIVRFQSHLKNLNDLLQSSGAEKGKRLDFTLQELAREINTITAKCSDSKICEQAINIKVEIEKAREQTQNIV